MTTAKRRIDKLETGLTPKQAILLWLQEAHAFDTIEEYAHQLKDQPDSAAPLDAETAAAIEAAKQHHVLTWEILEEGDDIGEWVRDTFVADGKTLLPDGAYLMRSGTKTSYMHLPTEEEVRDLFQDAEHHLMSRRSLDEGLGPVCRLRCLL